MIKDEYYILYNGIKIPKVGFGTWQSQDGKECYEAVRYAIEAGYRHIDTALVYKNEVSVGKAIKDSNLKREELFVTTKCPADIKTYEGAIDAFNTSLKNLDLEYIDLYLIHAPWPWSNVGGDYTSGNIAVWKAFVDLYNKGLIKAIGVSNFHPKDIDAIYKATKVMPMVNQIRCFLGNTQPNITAYCNDNGILVEAYSPLATGNILMNETLINIAKKYNKTEAQICLRYCLEKGTSPLPKSIHSSRIYQNIDLDFNIHEDDIKILDTIHDESLDRPLRS